MADLPNALTIDLEPWMCLYEDLPLSLELDRGHLIESTKLLLDLLDKHHVKATFFALGVVYQWYPNLIDHIASRGHEIAFHGYTHLKLSKTILGREILKSKNFLNRYSVNGFRAPQMYITSHDLKTLRSLGFTYDSSMYGLSKHFNTELGIKEVPVSTYPPKPRKKLIPPRTFMHALLNLELPVGSGLCLAILSVRFLNVAIRQINREGYPTILFIHPWQLLNPPASVVRTMSLPKMLYSLKISLEKLEHLLKTHNFTTIQTLLKDFS